MKKLLLTAGALFLAASTATADNPVVLNAVGTWSSLTNYQKHEEPFFNRYLAEESNGGNCRQDPVPIRPWAEGIRNHAAGQKRCV